MTRLTDGEKQTVGFYDSNATAWSDAHLDGGYWKKQLNEFKRLLPAGKVLEIGCGGGRDARDLIKRGYSYTGTDISAGLLKEARKNVPGQTFHQQSVYDLNFDEKFDGFWASAVLLHIPKKRINDALKSIKSVVKKEGIGYISIKNGRGERTLEDGRFFSFWTKGEFSKILEKNGFEIINFIHDPRSPTDDWLCFFVRAK
jgi:SAM-dependent methyltransferase